MGNKLSSNHQWCLDICQAIGEDPNLVRSIDLHIPVDGPVSVSIERYLDVSEIEIFQAIKKAEWSANANSKP